MIDYYRTPENDQLDQIFGDFEIKDLDKTAENKKLVRRFLTEIFQNKELICGKICGRRFDSSIIMRLDKEVMLIKTMWLSTG